MIEKVYCKDCQYFDYGDENGEIPVKKSEHKLYPVCKKIGVVITDTPIERIMKYRKICPPYFSFVNGEYKITESLNIKNDCPEFKDKSETCLPTCNEGLLKAAESGDLEGVIKALKDGAKG